MTYEKRNVILFLVDSDGDELQLNEKEARAFFRALVKNIEKEVRRNLRISFQSWKKSRFLLPCYYSHENIFSAVWKGVELLAYLELWIKCVSSYQINKGLKCKKLPYRSCYKCIFIEESKNHYFPCSSCNADFCYNTYHNKLTKKT